MLREEQTYFRRGFGLKGHIEEALTADYHSHVVDKIRQHGYVLALGDLTFKLAGYRSEVMQAMPAAGLRLRPTLERQAAPHRSHTRPPASSRSGSAPVDDIKSER